MIHKPETRTNDEGYLLLGLVVVCFLLVLALSVAAPRVAKQLERDREVESEHRAQEYVRAIQLYYRRTKRFPSSIDELLGSGTAGMSSTLNVKYLRQKYKDPLTHDDYRLIKVGTAKTEVKGFFGEPLQGAAVGNLGSVAGMQSSPGGGNVASAFGGSMPGAAVNGSSSGFSLGGSSFGAGSSATGLSSAGSATASTPVPGAAATGSTATGSGSTFGSGTDATTFQGSKAAFLGVGSNAKGHGLVEWNGSENIEEWEFLYDPRVELLKARVSIFGGSPAASGTGSLGTLPSATSPSIFAPAAGTGATNSTTNPSTITSPTGTSTSPRP